MADWVYRPWTVSYGIEEAMWTWEVILVVRPSEHIFLTQSSLWYSAASLQVLASCHTILLAILQRPSRCFKPRHLIHFQIFANFCQCIFHESDMYRYRRNGRYLNLPSQILMNPQDNNASVLWFQREKNLHNANVILKSLVGEDSFFNA
jgi:hypothetical protein